MTDGFESELVSTIAGSAQKSLNIIALRNVQSQRFSQFLNPKGSIHIRELTEEQINGLIGRFAEHAKSRGYVDLSAADVVREQLGHVAGWHPLTIDQLLKSTLTGDGQLSYQPSSIPGDVGLIKLQLIKLGDTLLTKIRSNKLGMNDLSPRQFEEVIAELFVEDGYSVELTKQTRDGGVDIFAWRRDVAGEFLTIVQCKKHSANNPVRVGVVREVVGSLNIHNASAAAIFTTSYFTDPAKEEVKRIENRLSITDYVRLMKLIGTAKY